MNDFTIIDDGPSDVDWKKLKALFTRHTVSKKRGFAAIGLMNPKDLKNVGGAIRAADCYEAAMVAVSGDRAGKGIRHCTNTPKAWRHMPVLAVEDVFDAIPYDCVPVAVDLVDGAESLVTYDHPERAYYIFGAEDATLGKKVLDRCRDRVYVPTRRCMNLAATVNVILYDRMAKGENPR